MPILRRVFVVMFILAVAASVLAAAALWHTYRKVSEETIGLLERQAIHDVIASESPVYYDDGVTPIGVFFQDAHKQFIRYDEIPEVFIQALVAAEDKNFFKHRGVDPKGILRAMVVNIRAGRVVQGGSTLTQQTAKNVFNRESRSFGAKFREMFQAFVLEENFSKKDILEMYVNQFFVTAYGKGLRIAAKYFFNKEPRDLDLVESAFIAGLVKGPNRYNPFIKKTAEKRDEAVKQANLRKNYVLNNMLDNGYITAEECLKARQTEVPFEEGKIFFGLNVILDYVRAQLELPYFNEILLEQGIANIATSGIRIHTSIQREIQQGAVESLRRHLPLLDVKLSGYNVQETQKRNPEGFGAGRAPGGEGLPFLARIEAIEGRGTDVSLVVSWDQGEGVVDYEGLKEVGAAWRQWKAGSWAEFGPKQVPGFLKNLKVGDDVAVRRAGGETADGRQRLELTRIPELEGGVVVLHQGMVKAMAGGFFNHFFNRAVDAKRQLGSIFKPIVYTAALQLKWNNLDPLWNTRDLFRFTNTYYFPRPDHEPKSARVSMSMAAAGSENLATVWLLYHLTDHLTRDEFERVAGIVGLAQEEEESYQAFVERIRDRHGVVVNERALREAAFEMARARIEPDLIFAGYESDLGVLDRLHYMLPTEPRVDAETDPEGAAAEREILRHSFVRLERLNRAMKADLKGFARVDELESGSFSLPPASGPGAAPVRFHTITRGPLQGMILYTESLEQWDTAPLAPVPMTPQTLGAGRLDPKKVLIDGLMTSAGLDLLSTAVKRHYQTLSASRAYAMDTLYRVRDYKTLVSLAYVMELSRQMGITTEMDPVLSFPLGPNAVSIMEGALAYGVMMSGLAHDFVGPVSPGPDRVPVITRIEDRTGEVIWEHTPSSRRVLTDRVARLSTELLRGVMEVGTGRSAWGKVRVSGALVPLFGKTGTANAYRNSSFIGYLPGIEEGAHQLSVRQGYVIAGYVGYDDNRPMQSEHLAIYGSSGALPIWVDMAKAIVEGMHYGEKLDSADLAFGTLQAVLPPGGGEIRPVRVSIPEGLPPARALDRGDAGTAPRVEFVAEVVERDGSLVLVRRLEPVQNTSQEERETTE